MKRIIVLEIILMSFIWSPIAIANIYTWTDENGVRHFTNELPPAGSKIFIEDWGPKSANSPETPNQIDNDEFLKTQQDLKDRLSETQEKLSETLEQVKALEDSIREATDRVEQTVESAENRDDDVIDDDAYSKSEDTSANHTNYYPVGILHHNHLASKSYYFPHRLHHRPYHKRGYHLRKKGFSEYRHRNEKFRSYHRKKHHLKGKHDKEYQYKNQHRRTNHLSSTLNRSRRLGVYSTRSQLRRGISNKSVSPAFHRRHP